MPQAEIFRLHGQLLAAVEDNDAANKAFATSLALWPQLAEGWLSWGTFCDKQVSPSRSASSIDLLNSWLTMESPGRSCGAPQPRGGTPLQAKGDVQNGDGQSWLENAVTCYLAAIRHGSAEGRGMMARILNLLSFHDTNGVVSKAIRKHGRQVTLSCTLPLTAMSVVGCLSMSHRSISRSSVSATLPLGHCQLTRSEGFVCSGLPRTLAGPLEQLASLPAPAADKPAAPRGSCCQGSAVTAGHCISSGSVLRPAHHIAFPA